MNRHFAALDLCALPTVDFAGEESVEARREVVGGLLGEEDGVTASDALDETLGAL